jgi:hypothetical protein
MPDYGHLMRNFATAAAQDLKPLIAEASEALGTDEKQTEVLGDFMARSWMAGAMAGQSEMVAQAIEQGANVSNEMVRAPRPSDEGKAGSST